jgi:RND family efflux transporter MFP subunit
LVLPTIGCSKQGKAAPVGGSDVPPSKVNLKRNVELTVAQRRAIDYTVETVGILEAEAQTDIAAGVSGVVDEVLFREGDQVTPDTVLLKVDQRRYTAAADVARSNEKRAEAAVALAKDLANRAQQARGSISEEERSKAVLSLRVAEAELESTRAARVLAEHNLARSRVHAPYAGRINQRMVTPGTYVEEKTPIATIADVSRIRLVGWVPETAAATVRDLHAQQNRRLEVNPTAVPLGGFLAGPWIGLGSLTVAEKGDVPSGYDPEFSLLAFPNRGFRGRIFYLSTVASPETHMFEFKAEVETKGLDVELRPGYTARIRLPVRSNAAACVIPEESVRATERGFVAFVPEQRQAKDGSPEWIARARTLELGYRAPGWVEVRKGMTPGERLVKRGAEALEDGTPIRFN